MAGMNHMRQVAKMLGIKWGEGKGRSEEFKVTNQGDKMFYFTEGGLWVDPTVHSQLFLLGSLVSGVFEVHKLPWKPEDGEPYYFVNLIYGDFVTRVGTWQGTATDKERFDKGMLFKTEGQAWLRCKQIEKFLTDTAGEGNDGLR
jgi:hypothetical protein